MKNWKTTLIAALLAALVASQTVVDADGFDISKDWLQLAIACGIAALGTLMKDYDTTGVGISARKE